MSRFGVRYGSFPGKSVPGTVWLLGVFSSSLDRHDTMVGFRQWT
jgi:hypothetical protein